MAVVGIDLGTTRSAVANIQSDGFPACIVNSEADILTPSIIFLKEEEGQIVSVVGKIAKNALVAKPEDVVQCVKRHMNEEDYVFIDSRGKEWRPETLSAFILKKLDKDAKTKLREKEEETTHAVITVPYYFADLERKRTQQAGEIAGLHVLGILDEPIAAVFSYALDNGLEPMTCCVYDFGGGTFDVAIVEITENYEVFVKATAGNEWLGGENIDEEIADYFASEFHAKFNIDVKDDFKIYNDFKKIAENAKENLGTLDSVPISLGAKGESFNFDLTREKYEELISPYIEQTVNALEDALIYYRAARQTGSGKSPSEDSEKERIRIIEELKALRDANGPEWEAAKKEEWNNINKILLVGGSSRIPLVKKRLVAATGKEPELADPDQAVARGAAIYAAWVAKAQGIDCAQPFGIQDILNKKTIETTESEKPGIVVTPVVSHSLGVKILDTSTNKLINSKLIYKGAQIPPDGLVCVDVFTPAADNATAVNIVILQKEEVEAELCREVGSYSLEGFPARPKGEILIPVIFRYNTQNTINVSALAIKDDKINELIDDMKKNGDIGDDVDENNLNILFTKIFRNKELTNKYMKDFPQLNAKIESKWLKEEELAEEKKIADLAKII
ncbi:MAG: Hsp70 family protein [Spirochaetales bacterium]|nr:Hsp70 family protein [Spirochaetales bacterium]